MKKRKLRIPIGLRTIKTAAAVIIAMTVVEFFGASDSKLVFAMLGAMAAVKPTFTESLESCFAEFVGVFLGAFAGVFLTGLKLPALIGSGIGVALVITLYNLLKIRYAPNLACLIVVMIFNTEGIQPFAYALERVWDSSIGLLVGMAINTLVFPYDNSSQIRALVESLDRDILEFLENTFDGDDVLPDAVALTKKINAMARQLRIFRNQKLLLHMRRQKAELEQFCRCEAMARELLARLEVLSRAGRPGRLNDENRQRLKACGADIRDVRPWKNPQERDIVTNYHVRQILSLRAQLLETLNPENKKEGHR